MFQINWKTKCRQLGRQLKWSHENYSVYCLTSPYTWIFRRIRVKLCTRGSWTLLSDARHFGLKFKKIPVSFPGRHFTVPSTSGHRCRRWCSSRSQTPTSIPTLTSSFSRGNTAMDCRSTGQVPFFLSSSFPLVGQIIINFSGHCGACILSTCRSSPLWRGWEVDAEPRRWNQFLPGEWI